MSISSGIQVTQIMSSVEAAKKQVNMLDLRLGHTHKSTKLRLLKVVLIS